MVPHKRRVGVVLPNGPAYFTRVFAGIGAYCRGRHTWRFVAWPAFVLPLMELEQTIGAQQPDGIIGQASDSWEQMVAAGRVKFVNAEWSRRRHPLLPRAGCDEEAIGRLAAAHFQERAIRHLAAYGQHDSLPSTDRIAAFVEATKQSSSTTPPVRLAPTDGPDDPDALEAWIVSLPKPVGIFCWNDEAAKFVHQQCQSANLRIPEDVALLGVDNDETICHFLDPPLSSIDPNAQRVGYEAAALLDRLMDGQPAPDGPILVPPIGVVTRASTELTAVDSPDVARAIAYIRQHAGSTLTVEDVLDHLAISRRSLEKQFQAVLGRSPRSEIHRVLVARAHDLLANTDLSIPTIADRCGYSRANHFTTMFRKQTGQTPTAYRKQTRLG